MTTLGRYSMSSLKGHIVTAVNQAGVDESGNTGAITSFGLPGTGSVRPSMSSCHFNVHAAVYEDLSVYIGIDGCIADPVTKNNYPVIFIARADDWSWSWGSGSINIPSNSGSWSSTIDANDGSAAASPPAGYWGHGMSADDAASTGSPGRGWFVWNFSCGDPAADNSGGAGSGYKRVGLLTDFHGNDENQDGYIYLSGTGSYEMDNPTYPDPVMITIPGFLAFLDYFPFAVRKSGTWMSCNRDGGSTTIRKGGSWRDVKNIARGTGDNQAFIRSGSAWSVAPEIGDK